MAVKKLTELKDVKENLNILPIIELKDTIYIEGQGHNFSNLMPKFLDRLFLKSEEKNIFAFNNFFTIPEGKFGFTSNFLFSEVNRNIFYAEDSDYFYIIPPNSSLTIYKIDKKTKSIVNYRRLGSREDNVVSIIDEDGDSLYVIAESLNDKAKGIGKISKATLNQVYGFRASMYYADFQYLFTEGDYIYIFVSYYQKSEFRVWAFSKTYGWAKELLRVRAKYNFKVGATKPFKVGPNNWVFYVPYVDENYTKYTINRITIDTNKIRAKREVLNTTFNVSYSLPIVHSNYNKLIPIIYEDLNSGDINLIFTFIEARKGSMNNDVSLFKFFISDKFNHQSDAVVFNKSVDSFNNGERLRLITPLDKSFEKFIGVYDNTLVFYGWSQKNKTISKIYSWNLSSVTGGVDSFNRVQVLDSLNNIYMLIPSKAVKVDIRWKYPDLEWTGTNINNELLISIYDLDGNRLEETITLQAVTDNVQFDTGKTKSVITSKEGDISVPVTITGKGYVYIEWSV